MAPARHTRDTRTKSAAFVGSSVKACRLLMGAHVLSQPAHRPVPLHLRCRSRLRAAAVNVGSTRREHGPVTATSGQPQPTERHVYQLDFVLTAHDDKTGVPSNTRFTVSLQEFEKGEVHVSENVKLTPTGQNRSDVGARVGAAFHSVVGDDLLLDVSLEVSAIQPSSNVQKVQIRTNALVRPGKTGLVTTLQDESRHYELTVTPTKLR